MKTEIPEPDFYRWAKYLYININSISSVGSYLEVMNRVEIDLQQIYHQGLVKGKLNAIEILEDLQRNVQTKIEK